MQRQWYVCRSREVVAEAFSVDGALADAMLMTILGWLRWLS